VQDKTLMALQNHVVRSSAIAAIGYDDETQDCFVTFKDGRSYTLNGFPEIELERWLGAGSIGGYWNANIKGNY
jgi:hypothetical protein